jgi:DNA primase
MDQYQSAKDEIKRIADIAELIGQYVQLKKAGQNYVGLCPFHGEKDPSFTVSPSKQMFHCFGCKKGGDIFAFWMEYHKVSFPQALKDLAERYRVPLPEKEFSPSQKKKQELKEQIFELNETAARYYNYVLTKTDKGKPGLKYLEKRGLGKDIIKDFMLGYAPPEWDSLTRFLKDKPVDMDKAVEAGLIIPNKNAGYHDRFRGRVLFPIHNIQKKVAGFGGRVLDESLPKYLNTPETPVFQKGGLLYGIYEAHRAIRENGRVVIVEGYMDVLALRSYGFNEVVATLGTSLTIDHIRRLKGYTEEAVVVFDSDKAGKGATIRSLPLFLNEGLTARVMVLPSGDDPDSFINKRGLKTFSETLDKAMPIFEFYIDLKVSRIKGGIEGQVKLLKEIIPVLSNVNSEPQRLLYARRFSEKSGIAESIVLGELRGSRLGRNGELNEDRLRKSLSSLNIAISPERDFLNLVIHYPQVMDNFIDSDYHVLLSDPNIIEIFRCVDESYKEEGGINPDGIFERLENVSARERYREVMLSPPICPGETLDQAVNEFKKKISKIKLSKTLRNTIGNLERSSQLLNEVKDMRD